MGLVILTNTAASNATAFSDVGSSTGAATGYTNQDIIAGNRSNVWRSTAVSSGGNWGVGYQFASEISCNYAVVTRADWLLTIDTQIVRIRQRSSGGTWSSITDFDPLASSDLVGYTGQDLVVEISPSERYGYGIRGSTKGGSTEAGQFSNLYFSNSFTFGHNPERGAQWITLSKDEQLFKPQRAWFPYATEKRITLTWKNITEAKYEAFKAIPGLMRWPLFLLEDDADDIAIFSWLLEHVIVEDYTAVRRNIDLWDVTVTFRRLKHYD